MKHIIKLILVVVMSVSCKAQVPQNMSVSEFHQNLRSKSNYHEQFRKEKFLNFYEKNKDEIWGKDGERKLWNDLAPFLKNYKDDSVIKLLLKDIDLSDYSGGVLFGWSPFVVASTNSKIYYVLDLIYSVEGVEGISKYYQHIKKNILEKEGGDSPLDYGVLTGLVCSLPDAEENTEKVELSKIVIDYFSFMSSRFLKEGKSSIDSSVDGFKEGLVSYYFYEKAKPRLNTRPYWPNEEKSFNIRKYFNFLKVEDQKRELSKKERNIVNQVQIMIINLARLRRL